VRSPTDIPPRARRLGRFSRRFWFGLAFVILLVGFLSLRNLAVLWTDQMWFSSVGLGRVFSTLLMVKLGLGLTFGAIFFFIMWGNLLLTDRFGARDLSFDPKTRSFVDSRTSFGRTPNGSTQQSRSSWV